MEGRTLCTRADRVCPSGNSAKGDTQFPETPGFDAADAFSGKRRCNLRKLPCRLTAPFAGSVCNHVRSIRQLRDEPLNGTDVFITRDIDIVVVRAAFNP